ncbi:MAG: glycine--tRNA ligase subunit beta, partial [bacterium]|nr:glycine--tRNA ligase subunit beta [bacterium]
TKPGQNLCRTVPGGTTENGISPDALKELKMPDLLLEIGTEEIPAAYLRPALIELKDKAAALLDDSRLAHGEVETAATPRRLVLYIRDAAEHQAAVTREVKGPAARVAFKEDGQPSPAAMGFARSQGVDVDRLEVRSVEGGEYVFAVIADAGTDAVSLLEQRLPGLISGLYFPKMQRWGDGELRFARPIRWLTVLFGDRVLDFSLDGLRSGNISYGHRFLAPERFTLSSPDKYWEEMSSRYVIVRQDERKDIIRKGAVHLAKEFQGEAVLDADLLDEVTFLVEYPTPFAGGFEPDYLCLPREVLISVMRKHQKFFPVAGGGENLLPLFIAVRNGLEEGLDTVREGNVKVLKARLSDARFFYDEDRKTRLEDRVASLGRVTFQEKLGSLQAKTERIRRLTRIIAEIAELSPEHTVYADRASLLCKADLVTNMVYEFPELQGSMGREYALQEGEPLETAVGIYEHYLPRFAGDSTPSTMVGAAVALADRLDTLAGFFGIGIRPTGSQDPYALRRSGNGTIRILLDAKLRVHLHTLLHEAFRGYGEDLGRPPVKFRKEETELVQSLYEFLGERLSAVLSEEGYAYDTIAAVLAVPYDDPVDARERTVVLEQWRKSPEFPALATAIKRVDSILKDFIGTEVREDLFQSEEEKALCRALSYVEGQADALLVETPADYDQVMGLLLSLCNSINDFFDHVMVMAKEEDIRQNRLSLLYRLQQLFREVADFGRLVLE